MRNREEHLLRLGYQQPLDQSPINPPDGWERGDVRNTGGGLFCRIWRTWGDNRTEENTFEYEVIYNLKQDKSVVLSRYRYEPDKGYYIHLDDIKHSKADHQTDRSMAETAISLMEYANNELREETTNNCAESAPSRDYILLTEGFQKPFNESPIKKPDGWTGGTVQSIGGGNLARIWWTRDKKDDTWYRVIYNLTDRNVALEECPSNDSEDGQTYEPMETREASHRSDYAMADEALSLMKYANQELRSPNTHPEDDGPKVVYKYRDSKIEKMERDVEEIGENYGENLWLENEFDDPERLPYLRLQHHAVNAPDDADTLDVADEVVSVIQNHGYDIAYVDFDNWEIAFELEETINMVPYDLRKAVDTCLETWDLTAEGDLSAIKLQDGYLVSIPINGELLDKDVRKNHGNLLRCKSPAEILYTGVRNGELLLTVKRMDD